MMLENEIEQSGKKIVQISFANNSIVSENDTFIQARNNVFDANNYDCFYSSQWHDIHASSYTVIDLYRC